MKLTPAFWKTYFEVYDVLNEVIPYQELLSAVAEGAKISKGDSVLDAGCGTGNLIPYLEKRGASVTGIDLSEEGLAVAARKSPSATLKIGDLHRPLPFKDGSFDAICSNNTVYALSPEARPALFAEFRRCLKPGGRLSVANIKEGLRPMSIYLDHLRRASRRDGVLRTALKAMKLVVPTIRVMHYNRLIKKADRSSTIQFMTAEEQRALFESAGFLVTGEAILYSGNATYTTGIRE